MSDRYELSERKGEKMSRKLTEAKVLKTLEIPDFRHMTKDKIGSFVSMLPNMDPEVAKKALDQYRAHDSGA